MSIRTIVDTYCPVNRLPEAFDQQFVEWYYGCRRYHTLWDWVLDTLHWAGIWADHPYFTNFLTERTEILDCLLTRMVCV